MKTFTEYMKDRWNVNVPEGNISGRWFKENFLPMVVRCSCCEMTMALPTALIDENGYTYCGECAGVKDEENYN